MNNTSQSKMGADRVHERQTIGRRRDRFTDKSQIEYF